MAMYHSQKKDLLLSLSEKTLFAALDREAENDLIRVRDRIKEPIAMVLGDSRLETVEMLALPLLHLPGEPDPAGIKIDLEAMVGVRDWPLGFEFTKLNVARDDKTGQLFVTIQLMPDDYAWAALAGKFLQGMEVQAYPPIRLFKVSSQGWPRANSIHMKLEKLPPSITAARFSIEVQVKGLLLVSAYQTFKLRLCGLEGKNNNLQWVDLRSSPVGASVKDFHSRFKGWSPEDRISPIGGALSEDEMRSPLGRVCPWLTKDRFKTKWANLHSGVELVYTPGVVSKTDKVLALADQPQTTQMLRESLLYHHRNYAGRDPFMHKLWAKENEVISAEVMDALETLGQALDRAAPATNIEVDQIRDSELGFDATGQQMKRMSFAGVHLLNKRKTSFEDAEDSLLLRRDPTPPPTVYRPPTPLRGKGPSLNNMMNKVSINEVVAKKNEEKAEFPPPKGKRRLRGGPGHPWVADLRLPAVEGAIRQWSDLWDLLGVQDCSPAALKTLLLTKDFSMMLQRLGNEEVVGLDLNLLELVEVFKENPELGKAVAITHEQVDRLAKPRGFSEEQLKIIHRYANVLNMAALAQAVPEEFEQVGILPFKDEGFAMTLNSPKQVWNTLRRSSIAAVDDIKRLRKTGLDPRYAVLQQGEPPEAEMAPMLVLQTADPDPEVDEGTGPGAEDPEPDESAEYAEIGHDYPVEWTDLVRNLPPPVLRGDVCPDEKFRQRVTVEIPTLPAESRFVSVEDVTIPAFLKLINHQPTWDVLLATALEIGKVARATELRSQDEAGAGTMDYLSAWLILLQLPNLNPSVVNEHKRVVAELEIHLGQLRHDSDTSGSVASNV